MVDDNTSKLPLLVEKMNIAKDYFDRYIKECENPDTLLANYLPEVLRKVLQIQDGIVKILSELDNEDSVDKEPKN